MGVFIFNSVLHRGQLDGASGVGVDDTDGASFTVGVPPPGDSGIFSLKSAPLDVAGGVSGGDSEPGESGGDPGGESAPESGGDPGGDSAPESMGESGGEPGGESASSLSWLEEIRLVAELKKEEPKPNILPDTASAAAAGGLFPSPPARPPKPPKNFPVTDSVA